MGCIGSSGGGGDSTPAPPPPKTGGYVPQKIDLGDIMGPPPAAEPPAGFPPKPNISKTFPGGGEDEYKAWMRSKATLENWENGVTLYRIKEKAGDGPGMEAVITRIRAECG